MPDSVYDNPGVNALDATARRHVHSLLDVRQRELWEFRDGSNDDPEGYNP